MENFILIELKIHGQRDGYKNDEQIIKYIIFYNFPAFRMLSINFLALSVVEMDL